MDKYICIHGHFYQPPRENPWLEAIEIQDSAYPYHDWNERIHAECYGPNAAARILDNEGRIMDIVSNYTRISFNFGPTVLSWMENYATGTYQAILNADKQSIGWRSGHGNAIAQPYNHIIMPLASNADKRTQIIWGIKDFEHRFKRYPEGMWIPETAVNNDTLELLAEYGIKFTILAPHQALRLREINTAKWHDISGRIIDPTRAYRCRLPSGRVINIFFYDGYISNAVAFERLLSKGEDFVSRLMNGFSESSQWPQFVNIATDGETYGHHHRFGEMALVYALNYIESGGLAKLTNYGEYLEKYPPTHEVEIVEYTSWSCSHGVERWRNNCGCNSGGHPGWHQEWRKPLRDTLDWLREHLALRFEDKAKEYLKDPWKARDEYIDVILNRSEENIHTYFDRHAIKNLNREEKVLLLKLLEIQRHTMLMYTSCGWFFDDLSGTEAVQVLQYAGRALQLSEEIFNHNLRESFLEKLSAAKSNISEYGNGANIYERFVKPGMIDLKRVGVHYAVSSLFEEYPETTNIYCYSVTRRDFQRMQIGRFRLATGWLCLTSEVTWRSECLSFSVIHLGDHIFNGGVHPFPEEKEYQRMTDEIITAFKNGSFADIIRLMDTYFGTHNYSIGDLFRDEQRKILNIVIGTTIEEFEASYRLMYENNNALMNFLLKTGVPIPKVFFTAAEFTLNLELKKAFERDLDSTRIQQIVDEIKKWNVSVDSLVLEFVIRCRIEGFMENFRKNPSDISLLQNIEDALKIFPTLPLEINLCHTQNIYFKMVKTVYRDFLQQAKAGDKNKAVWTEEFKQIGKRLFFNTDIILSHS